jgi:acetyl esterase/lipase
VEQQTAMLSLAIAASIMSPEPASERPIFTLWPKGNPGGWTRDEKEITEPQGDILVTKFVSTPTLEFFAAPNAAPDAPTVIICPGGGYWLLAIEHEGWDMAKMLNQAGIHAAVLKYRLPVPERDKVKHQAAWEDAQRSIRLLRSKAAELKLNPARIGIMGFSAGGHLAAFTSCNPQPSTAPIDEADKQLSNPDFTVLIYSAYLVAEGEKELKTLMDVSEKTPPVFIAHTMDDPLTVNSALAYMAACKEKGVPVEAHIYPKGGHGYGLRSKEPGLRDWPNHLVSWLKRLP